MTIIVKPPQYDYRGLSVSQYVIISIYCPSLLATKSELTIVSHTHSDFDPWGCPVSSSIWSSPPLEYISVIWREMGEHVQDHSFKMHTQGFLCVCVRGVGGGGIYPPPENPPPPPPLVIFSKITPGTHIHSLTTTIYHSFRTLQNYYQCFVWQDRCSMGVTYELIVLGTLLMLQ